MSKLNLAERQFNTTFRRSTILHPNVQSGKLPRDYQVTAKDYVEVPTISTRGSWPAVHMISEDTFVQMAILAGHVKAPKAKRAKHISN